MPTGKLAQLIGGFGILYLVHTAYVASFATPSIPYMMSVLFHLLGGIALAIACGVLAARVPEVMSELRVPTLFFLVSIGFALLLTFLGNVRAHRWVLVAHVVTA